MSESAALILRAALIAAAAVFGFWLIVCSVLWAVQTKMVYHPSRDILSPEAYGLEDVKRDVMTTRDGHSLEIWSAEPEEGRPVIAFFHGNAGNLSHRVPIFRMFQDAGLGFVAMDYRGYGNSTGRPRAQDIRLDSEALLNRMNSLGMEDAHIIAYGESLGSGIAAELAARRDLAGLVVQSGYTSTLDVAKATAPFAPVNLLFTERFDTLNNIGLASAPVLIMHGSADATFPVSMALANAAAAPAPVMTQIFPGAGHDLDPETMTVPFRTFLTWVEK